MKRPRKSVLRISKRKRPDTTYSYVIMIDGEAIAMIRLINPMDSRIETFGRNMIPSDHEVKVMWYGKEANQETTITHENLPRRANV